MTQPTATVWQDPFTRRFNVLTVARRRLSEDSLYGFYFRQISFEFADGTLVLKGRLPTFYLKRVLQALLRNIDGVRKIDNRVDVVNSSGLSSVRAIT